MKYPVSIVLFFAAFFLLFSTGVLSEKIDPVTHDVLPEPDDVLYNRAPDPLPWIPAELLDPGFWIARMKNPDEIILSPDAISRMNEAYRKWRRFRISSADFVFSSA